MSDDRQGSGVRDDVAHGIGPDGTNYDDGKTNTVGLGPRGEMGDAAAAETGDGEPSGIRPGGPLGGGTGGGTAGAGGSGNDGMDTNIAHGADGIGIGAAGVGSPGEGHAGETDQVITGKPPAEDHRPVGGSSPFDD